jgi:hypothetical protein
MILEEFIDSSFGDFFDSFWSFETDFKYSRVSKSGTSRFKFKNKFQGLI